MNFKWDLKSCFKEKKQQQTTNAVLRKRSMDSIAICSNDTKTLLLRIQDYKVYNKIFRTLFWVLLQDSNWHGISRRILSPLCLLIPFWRQIGIAGRIRTTFLRFLEGV